MKICRSCKRDLPIAAFRESTNSDDGRFPMCIACVHLASEAQLKNYYRYFPNLNKGLSDFVRNSCYDSVWRGKVHG